MTETKFRDYVDKELQLNEARIQTERVRRLKSKGKPSLIIVHFSFYKDRVIVLKKNRDMRKAKREANAGKNDNSENENDVDLEPAVRIGEDFPYRVRNGVESLSRF